MMFIVADAHLDDGAELDGEFKAMLKALSRTDCDVVFLGDIMDLWIAKPRYEKGCHQAFIDWCRAESARRKVYFVEGNHEFFVASSHKDVFTTATTGSLRLEDALFVHGHAIQGKPWSFNRWFIPLSKSWLGSLVLALMPFGQAFARRVKRSLGNRHPTPVLPEEEVRRWAAPLADKGELHELFLGHFHKGGEFTVGELRCHALPAWKCGGMAALYAPDTHSVTVGKWRELLEGIG